MSHAEVVLPNTVAVGFESDCDFPVDIVKNFAGLEFRNLNAEDAVRTYRASIVGKTRTQTEALMAFHMARGGMSQSFNHKDHFDFAVSITEGVFTTLTATTFQMWKRYSSTGTRDRKILKLQASGIVVKQGATTLTLTTQYTVDITTGIVTTIGSPQITPTTWSCTLFYTPVRFTGPRKIISLPQDPELFSWGDLGMVEVLNP